MKNRHISDIFGGIEVKGTVGRLNDCWIGQTEVDYRISITGFNYRYFFRYGFAV